MLRMIDVTLLVNVTPLTVEDRLLNANKDFTNRKSLDC